MDVAFIRFMYEVLRDRPELGIVVVSIVAWYMERSERRTLQQDNIKLVDKLATQNADTNELLGHIKFLLEMLTRSRI